MSLFLEHCPFCNFQMAETAYPLHVWRGCENVKCARKSYYSQYQIVLSENCLKLETEKFMISDYYIVVDFVKDFTKVIYIKDMTLMFDIVYGTLYSSGIHIPYAVKFDIKNYQATLDKIKTIIIFS